MPVRIALLSSAAGSLMLAAGSGPTWCLLVGRCLSGAAAGAVLAPGTAWVTDLSADPKAAPRRVAIALSFGFGGGPLVAGVIAQWAPAQGVTPYVIHLALAAGAGVLLRGTPDPAIKQEEREWQSTTAAGVRPPTAVWGALSSRAFWSSVPLTAPWVFGGVVAGVTLAAGVLVQPLARRLEQHREGRAMQVGLMLASVGMALSAIALATGSPGLLLPNAVVLGAAYGVALVSGLRRMEALGHPRDRARLNAVFYALTYVGFAVPLAFTLTTSSTRSQVLFALVGAAAAAATLIQLTWSLRNVAAGSPRTPDRWIAEMENR